VTIGPKKFYKKLSYARDLALIDLPYHFGIRPSFRSMVASAILRQYHTLGFMSSSFCYNLWIANLPSFGTDSVASKGVSYFKTLHQSTARRLLSSAHLRSGRSSYRCTSYPGSLKPPRLKNSRCPGNSPCTGDENDLRRANGNCQSRDKGTPCCQGKNAGN
jgi:hypothetical protein